MKKLFFILFASTAFGALSPLGNSIRELQTLLSDRRLYNSFKSGESIEEVMRQEKGYRILTEHYSMDVELVYTAHDRQIIGPPPLHFIFHPPRERALGL